MYLLMYEKMMLVTCQYGTTSEIAVAIVKTINFPMWSVVNATYGFASIKREHVMVIIMNNCKIWFSSFCTNIFQVNPSSDSCYVNIFEQNFLEYCYNFLMFFFFILLVMYKKTICSFYISYGVSLMFLRPMIMVYFFHCYRTFLL